MIKPKRQSRYTAASRAMPASHSLRKLETTPMVKKVIVKKMPRKMLASPTDALSLGTIAGQSRPMVITAAKVKR